MGFLSKAWKEVKRTAKRVGKEATRAADKATGGALAGSFAGTLAGAVFGPPGMVIGSALGAYAGQDVGYSGMETMARNTIDAMLGKEPDPAVPYWTQALGTASNEGATKETDDERRRRLAAGYSLSSTRSARAGKVLGGTIGGAGTGGASSTKTGGTV